ncbi:MAG TPA: RDD family protein [Blastocatellia bacterium]|nr:RDD family protein [Blastocatellia bacterium]
MPKFCQRCGAHNVDWAQACQNCSTPLPGQQAGNQQAYYPNYPPQPGPGYNPYPPMYGYGFAPARYQPGAYAGMGKRFWAYLLEGLLPLAGAIPGFVLLIIGIAIADSRRSSDQESGAVLAILGILVMIIGYVAILLYNIYLLGKEGASLPKRWLGIVVLDRQGRPIGFGKAFAREIVKGLLANATIILLMWPLWDQEKQAIYDKLFDANVYEKSPYSTSLYPR